MTIPHCHGKQVTLSQLHFIWGQNIQGAFCRTHKKWKPDDTINCRYVSMWVCVKYHTDFWSVVLSILYWGLCKHAHTPSPPSSPLPLLWVNHRLTMLSPLMEPSPPLWGENWRGAASALFTLDSHFLRFGNGQGFEGYSELWRSRRASQLGLCETVKSSTVVAGW